MYDCKRQLLEMPSLSVRSWALIVELEMQMCAALGSRRRSNQASIIWLLMALMPILADE